MIELLTLILAAQLATAEIVDKVTPKNAFEVVAFQYINDVDDKVSKQISYAVSAMKGDKQITGTNPRYVYAIFIRGLSQTTGKPVEEKSGAFASKEDALTWLQKKVLDPAKELPELLPKEPVYILHTCDHGNDGNGQGGCTEETIKP